ncbi:MAG TPA: cupin domain-containing protein [Candidatus Eisenbacteria bacterium]|nr:cupin domain-containing protein [Candidatus Eisenbacteria bacterium]
MDSVGRTQEDLERFLAEHHLVGAGLRRDSRAQPRRGNTAAHWKWDGIYHGLLRSGQIVTVGPDGMTGMRSVTGIEARNFPIWMNAQILMPGERTQAHRNLRSETRLVCEAPPEAIFVCEYESYPMERGDVVVSPPWTFHDHWNRGKTPAIWIDGYDNGYNPNVNINERMANDQPYEEIRKPAAYGERVLGHARRVVDETPFPLPPMRYPWRHTKAALMALREAGERDPYDGVFVMLASPVDAGPTLPTIAWQAQLFARGEKTLAHRHNSTTFYFAFEGEGAVIIEGERLEYQRGDIFAVPAWKWHHHENTSGQDSILFSIDDWPAMKKLGFYMKENQRA